MNTIYKYDLISGSGIQTIVMPTNNTVLSLQLQDGMPVIWAQVDTIQPSKPYNFTTLYTGQDMSYSFNGTHVGTYQLNGLVYHVYQN